MNLNDKSVKIAGKTYSKCNVDHFRWPVLGISSDIYWPFNPRRARGRNPPPTTFFCFISAGWHFFALKLLDFSPSSLVYFHYVLNHFFGLFVVKTCVSILWHTHHCWKMQLLSKKIAKNMFFDIRNFWHHCMFVLFWYQWTRKGPSYPQYPTPDVSETPAVRWV